MSIASSEQVKLIRQRCGNTYSESEWRQFLEDLKAEMSSLTNIYINNTYNN